MFPRGLQKTLRFKAGLKVELDECEKIINNIKMGYPRLSRWQDEVKKRAGFRAYTETWLGRRRAIPEIRSATWSVKAFAERVAMNTPIQGTAADIVYPYGISSSDELSLFKDMRSGRGIEIFEYDFAKVLISRQKYGIIDKRGI